MIISQKLSYFLQITSGQMEKLVENVIVSANTYLILARNWFWLSVNKYAKLIMHSQFTRSDCLRLFIWSYTLLKNVPKSVKISFDF